MVTRRRQCNNPRCRAGGAVPWAGEVAAARSLAGVGGRGAASPLTHVSGAFSDLPLGGVRA